MTFAQVYDTDTYNPRLVAAIGRHCPRLQLLDLSGTEQVLLSTGGADLSDVQVTEEGIKKLYRMNVGGEVWPTELVCASSPSYSD